jgi:hypothetical protein
VRLAILKNREQVVFGIALSAFSRPRISRAMAVEEAVEESLFAKIANSRREHMKADL